MERGGGRSINTHLEGGRGEEESGRERTDTNTNFLCCPLRGEREGGREGGREGVEEELRGEGRRKRKRKENRGRAKERAKG